MVSKNHSAVKDDETIIGLFKNDIASYFLNVFQMRQQLLKLLVRISVILKPYEQWHLSQVFDSLIDIFPCQKLRMQYLDQGLVQLLVPICIFICYLNIIDKILHIILHYFPLNLHGQH